MANFARPTLDEIYNRVRADMQSRVTTGVPIPRYSLLGVMALVFAGAIYLCYGFLNWIADQLFSGTSSEENLERDMRLYGIPRLPATYTTGQVNFAGTVDGTVVPAGTIIVDGNGTRFSTDADVIIAGGIALANCTALEYGSASNTSATQFNLERPIANISSTVSYVFGFDNGQDKEALPTARERMHQRLSNPPASGTRPDYVRWATEVPGCGKAWCFTAENTDPSSTPGLQVGGGRVVVVIATDTLEVVSPTVHNDVVAHLAEVKPADAMVTVYDIIPQTLDYSLTIVPDTAAFRQTVESELSAMHLAQAGPVQPIFLSHITAALSSAGLTNFSVLNLTYKATVYPPQDIMPEGLDVVVRGAVNFV